MKYYIFTDFEFNTFDKRYPEHYVPNEDGEYLKQEIIQLGLVITDTNFKVIKRLNYYVKPIFSKAIQWATAKTVPYNFQFLLDNGTEFVEVITELTFELHLLSENLEDFYMCIFGTCDTPTFEKNCQFNNILTPEFNWINIQSKIYHAVNILTSTGKLSKFPSLARCCEVEQISTDTEKAHDALYDANLLYCLTKKLVTEGRVTLI